MLSSSSYKRDYTLAPTLPLLLAIEALNVTLREDIKVSMPNKYNGNLVTLREFLMKSSMYLEFHRDKFLNESNQVY